MSIGEVFLPVPGLRKTPSLHKTLLCLSRGSPVHHEGASIEALSRVLLHVQGCRGKYFRTVPSAGATYPLEIYFASSGGVFELPKGLYRYVSCRGKLVRVADGDFSEDRFLVVAVYERTTRVYGSRGYMYVREEVGHLLQNLALSLISHGLRYKYTLEPGISAPEGRPEAMVEVYRSDGFCGEKATGMSLDEAIVRRRSVRAFKKRPLSPKRLVDVLGWSLQGHPDKYFTVFGRQARAISLYVVAARVEGLDEGIYVFNAEKAGLELIRRGPFSRELYKSALMQRCVLEAPANVVILGEPGGAVEYVAGAVGQNIYLNSTAQGLGTVAVGAFYDEEVVALLGTDARPLYIMPIGEPAVVAGNVGYSV